MLSFKKKKMEDLLEKDAIRLENCSVVLENLLEDVEFIKEE